MKKTKTNNIKISENISRGVFIILLVMIQFACNNRPNEELSVIKGQFKQSFTETGELAAIKAAVINMPPINYRFGYEYKIIEMVENGSMIQKGDTVVKLDASTIQKFIITQKESLENENAAAKKQAVEIQNNLQELQANLKIEQASYNLKKLQLERGQYDSEKKKKILELEFQQATIKMDKVKRQMKMKPILSNCDLKVQKIKIMQKESQLQEAYAALNRMSLTSPEDGLFQVGKNMFTYPQTDLKVGDMVFQEAPIARIPDIKRMNVNSFVNEADLTKVAIGTKVIVRMDALPSVLFHGNVTEISKICLPRDKEKVFNVKVEIQKSDLRLKPGMTVSCEYICYEGENELYVPNKCIYKEKGRDYVFISNGSSTQKLEVSTGLSNTHHTLIYSDIQPGQRLIPFENVLNQKKI